VHEKTSSNRVHKRSWYKYGVTYGARVGTDNSSPPSESQRCGSKKVRPWQGNGPCRSHYLLTRLWPDNLRLGWLIGDFRWISRPESWQQSGFLCKVHKPITTFKHRHHLLLPLSSYYSGLCTVFSVTVLFDDLTCRSVSLGTRPVFAHP
jgi:hypothetical protein